MREHAPVHWHPPAKLPGFWSLTRYSDIRAVYRNPGLFSSASGVLLRAAALGEDPGGGLTMALTDPPRHHKLRSLIASQFDERCARSLDAVMAAEVREVITEAIERGECDLAHDIGARLAINSISRALGVPEQDYQLLLEWTTQAFACGKPLTAHQGIMRYFIEFIYARMEAPAKDGVSLLASGQVDGERLTDEEILLNCENLVGATENAGISMAAGLLAFLGHRDQWRLLAEDRGLMTSAIEEVLRWTSSATHSLRTATADTTIGGQPISAGDKVVLWIPSANYDPTAFANPARFDIARQPNRHLALGAGEHVCIGGTIARHQMRALFGYLIDARVQIEPTGPVLPLRSIAVNGPASAPVRLSGPARGPAASPAR
jgi:cytochrome P450